MSGSEWLDTIATAALAGQVPDQQSARRILTDPSVELLPLMQAAFRVRFHHFGRGVRIHILNNVQNGYCSEDCNYCVQAKNSKAPIQKYAIKSDEEILDGARKAYESGAYRYCMVSSGRNPHADRIDHMSKLIKEIKSRWPVEVCLSAGFLDADKARELKEAGLDRYNHNLNTADGHYGSICTTHSYGDRLDTLKQARSAGLEVCSGIIIGMGEKPEEIIEVASTLRGLNARSIPVNFYVHVEGSQLGEVNQLTPEYGLRALALFRFFNPDAEVRAAGGRESNLRGLESMALYPANSLFAEGYLNTSGHVADKTVKLVEDAGFFVEKIEED
ncbi:biotin synthase BioB [Magnetococcus sp. PR-3]|uniref:biotin synthase BioB n=1 Tax=Magnetococcus sp. PR-3 TaxID=3120355 RepID=UPI002FCE0109